MPAYGGLMRHCVYLGTEHPLHDVPGDAAAGTQFCLRAEFLAELDVAVRLWEDTDASREGSDFGRGAAG